MHCVKRDYSDCNRTQLVEASRKHGIPVRMKDMDETLRRNLVDWYNMRHNWVVRNKGEMPKETPMDMILRRRYPAREVNKHFVETERSKRVLDWVTLGEWYRFENVSNEKLRYMLFRHGYSTEGPRSQLLSRLRKVRKAVDRSMNYELKDTMCGKILAKKNSKEFINNARKRIRDELGGVNKSNWKQFFRSKNGLRKMFNLYDKYFFDFKFSEMLKLYMRKLTFLWDTSYDRSSVAHVQLITDRDVKMVIGEDYVDWSTRTCIKGDDPFEPGTSCNTMDPVYAVMVTFEHELVHIIIGISCNDEGRMKDTPEERERYQVDQSVKLNCETGHPPIFWRIVNNLFRQTVIEVEFTNRYDKFQNSYQQSHPRYSILYDGDLAPKHTKIRKALAKDYSDKKWELGDMKAKTWLREQERRYGVELHPDGDEAHSWLEYPESIVNTTEGLFNMLTNRNRVGHGIIEWFRGYQDSGYPHKYPSIDE